MAHDRVSPIRTRVLMSANTEPASVLPTQEMARISAGRLAQNPRCALHCVSHSALPIHVEQKGLTILRFGLVAVLLEMIPIISILFTFTNTGESTMPTFKGAVPRGANVRINSKVGAALWAADMEANQESMAVDPLVTTVDGGQSRLEAKTD